jgi:hypothetical protein
MVESAENNGPRERGVWQWFWRSAELARARQDRRDVPATRRLLLGRARAAEELAERALEPTDPLRTGSSLPLSLSLYREAAYWSLCAQRDAPAEASLAEAFAATNPEVIAFAAGGAEQVELVESALLAKSFRESADDPPEQQRKDALVLRAFVRALINLQLGPERREGRALVQRWVRTGVGAALLLAVILTTIFVGQALARGPDLAKGKPWVASSILKGVPKAERREYLFHTQEEDSPWVQFDLGAPTTFSTVEVTNRQDCCPERAAPAVIEVSNDASNWKQVAQRKDSYSVWTARFAPTSARYVRVRVTRRSMLHLAAVTVRAR